MNKKILIDISSVVRNDVKTGVQRVVRSFVKNLKNVEQNEYTIHPVYASSNEQYKYANQYLFKNFGDTSKVNVPDDYVNFSSGDILFIPDICFDVVFNHTKTYQNIRDNGGKIVFFVHDILPMRMPQHFPQQWIPLFNNYFKLIYNYGDAAITGTMTVARDYNFWIKENKLSAKNFNIGWNHLGADIKASVPSVGAHPGILKELDRIIKRPTFLMVGTIEPRKGHLHAIKAAEKLWEQGENFNLFIVGKAGWMVEQTIGLLKNSKEFDRKLFWFNNVSDYVLDEIYNMSSCILMASEGEGFGLPLIEAAQHNKPVLARDIPVFREIGKNFINYFPNGNHKDLAASMRKWLKKYNIFEKHENKIPFITWQESSNILFKMLTDSSHNNWILK